MKKREQRERKRTNPATGNEERIQKNNSMSTRTSKRERERERERKKKKKK